MARIRGYGLPAPDACAAVPADVRVVAAKRPAADVVSRQAMVLALMALIVGIGYCGRD
jgi:hypothetical protein